MAWHDHNPAVSDVQVPEEHTGVMTSRVPRRVLPGSPFGVSPDAVPSPERFAVDDRVSHDRHGLGTVVAIEGESVVRVDFGSAVHRLTVPNAKLIKL